MAASLRTRLIGAWIVAAVILSVGGIAVYHQYRDVNRQAQWLDHTREVINTLAAIEAQSWRAESYIRAYKLTNDQQFLVKRSDAVDRIRKLIKDCARLTLDNPTQQDAIKQLEATLDRRLAVGTNFMLMQKRGSLTHDKTVQSVELGNTISVKLEAQIKSMEQEEERLLTIRQMNFSSDDQLANFYLIIVSIFAISCVLAAIALTITYLTERTRMETRFRAIFDGTFQFLGMLSPDGSIQDINKTTLEFSGFSMKDVLGKPFWDGPWWGESKEAREQAQKAVQEASKGKFTRWETTYFGSNGKSITVDFSIKPSFDERGTLAFLIPEGRDITERVAAENEVRLSEQKLQSVLSSVAEGIYQIDTDGNLVFMNAAAEKMTLVNASQSLGKNMHTLIHSKYPDGRERAIEDCPLIGVVHRGEPLREREDWFQRADGTFFPVEYVSSPLFYDGEISGAVVAFQDITQRREAESRVSEFYSAVSHELRTPLTSIRGALRLMEGGKAGELTERGKQLVKMGRQECDRLVRLINDILDIRKIEAGKLELKIEKLDVADVVKQCIENLNNVAAEHRVSLTSDFVGKTTIRADKDRLIQILTNLISNAIKFSPDGGVVKVKVQAAGSDLRFEIRDDGPGISATNQEKLFKLFQQVDSTDARPKGGTGLGLAISLALVQMHEGTIGVDSAEGKGSTFWFQLPVRNLPEQLIPEEVDHDTERPELLVVEDDDALSSLLALSLVDQFKVRRVDTIGDAFQALATMKPSAILLDMHLPDGTGLELLEQLRKSADTQDIPVVVMSGSEPAVGKFTQPVVVDYLQKPFKETDLLTSLGRAPKYRPKRNARALIAEDDEATQDVLKDQLERIGVDCQIAKSGERAVELLFSERFDLLVLDLGLPDVSGSTVVDVLKKEGMGDIPLLVYTAQDLSNADQRALTLGMTKHLTKSIASEEEFVAAVRGLLKDLVRHEATDTLS